LYRNSGCRSYAKREVSRRARRKKTWKIKGFLKRRVGGERVSKSAAPGTSQQKRPKQQRPPSSRNGSPDGHGGEKKLRNRSWGLWKYEKERTAESKPKLWGWFHQTSWGSRERGGVKILRPRPPTPRAGIAKKLEGEG